MKRKTIISGTFFFLKGTALTIQEMLFFNSSTISASFDLLIASAVSVIPKKRT